MIFFGWPGHYEADEAPGLPVYGASANGGGASSAAQGGARLGGAPNQAQAPRELLDGRRRAPGSRQLACVPF